MELSGLQSELATRWLERMPIQVTRARDLAGSLPPTQLDWRPPEGGWSMAEVFEHLVISADLYHDPMAIHAAAGPFVADPTSAQWKAGLVGGLIIKALISPRKATAPKPFRPEAGARDNVVEAFCTRHVEMARLLAACGSVDWRRCRFRSPVMPLARMNLGDCFSIMVAHVERHLGQIERIRAHVAFP